MRFLFAKKQEKWNMQALWLCLLKWSQKNDKTMKKIHLYSGKKTTDVTARLCLVEVISACGILFSDKKQIKAVITNNKKDVTCEECKKLIN